jgi:formyl-CoA transferase
VRVIDLGNLLAGPFVATLLADMGADVVKFEVPVGGDALRSHGARHPGSTDSLHWKVWGRNKQSLTADLRTAAGRDRVLDFARHADVLVDGFRPGALERWGLGWDVLSALNPRLIMCRVSGFGQTGPYRDRPGFGTLAEAMSGFAAINGWPDGPPTLPPVGFADGIAGIAGAFSVLAALRERDQVSSLGQCVDVALVEPIQAILGAQLSAYELLGIEQRRTGNTSTDASPRGAYECADGAWIVVSGSTQRVAERVFVAMGRPDLVSDPRYATPAARRVHNGEVDALVAGWVMQLTRTEVLSLLLDADVPAAPVMSAGDFLADEHFTQRGSYIRIVDPEVGPMPMPNTIARLSRTPGTIRHTGPSLGADDENAETIVARWRSVDEATSGPEHGRS